MSNKESKKTALDQIKKTEYAEELTALNNEVVTVLGRQAELNASAYDLAKRVADTFSIGITDIFKVFLSNFDTGTAKYCYLVHQSEKYSWMYDERVSGLFSKIRLVGYLLSKNSNFEADLKAKITVNKITLRVIDLPYQSFKVQLTGKNGKNPDDIISNFSKTFKAVVDKYIDDIKSPETLNVLSDTVSTVLNAVQDKVKEIRTAEAKKQAEKYQIFLKDFGLKDSDKAKKLFKSYVQA